MEKHTSIKLFESKRIRTHWDENEEKWYFSVVDVVEALTESVNPTDYLKKLRKRDTELGFYRTNCPQIEMKTESGKNRKTLAGQFRMFFVYSIHLRPKQSLSNNGCQSGLRAQCRKFRIRLRDRQST